MASRFTGFGDDEIGTLLGLDEKSTAKEDDYDVVLPEEPKEKPGDIYQLGRHRLMCGDSTKPENVEQLMDGRKADLFLTDPPYNVDYEGKTKDSLKPRTAADEKTQGIFGTGSVKNIKEAEQHPPHVGMDFFPLFVYDSSIKPKGQEY